MPQSTDIPHKVKATGVCVRFEGTGDTATLALDQFSLTVDSGEFISIVGPSGCGKSTFLNCLAGLTPLSSGRLLVDGVPVTGPGRNRGMVFQSPSLFPWRTVQGNIMYSLERQKVPKATALRRASAAISLVGLEGFANHHPAQLSGGMQQRVNLARALVVDPEILLLDEPFASLDAQTREVMQLELTRIWAEVRHTAIFVTHQTDEAAFLADRVIVLSSRPGRVLVDIPVPFPWPRSLELKRSAPFHELEDEIWRHIELDPRFAGSQAIRKSNA